MSVQRCTSSHSLCSPPSIVALTIGAALMAIGSSALVGHLLSSHPTLLAQKVPLNVSIGYFAGGLALVVTTVSVASCCLSKKTPSSSQKTRQPTPFTSKVPVSQQVAPAPLEQTKKALTRSFLEFFGQAEHFRTLVMSQLRDIRTVLQTIIAKDFPESALLSWVKGEKHTLSRKALKSIVQGLSLSQKTTGKEWADVQLISLRQNFIHLKNKLLQNIETGTSDQLSAQFLTLVYLKDLHQTYPEKQSPKVTALLRTQLDMVYQIWICTKDKAFLGPYHQISETFLKEILEYLNECDFFHEWEEMYDSSQIYELPENRPPLDEEAYALFRKTLEEAYSLEDLPSPDRLSPLKKAAFEYFKSQVEKRLTQPNDPIGFLQLPFYYKQLQGLFGLTSQN